MRTRKAPMPDSDPLSSINIEFGIPTFISREHERELQQLVEKIVKCDYNQPACGVHWVSGYGSQPNWSQQDALFLGKPVDTNAPERGEPTFDDSILHIETSYKAKS